MRRGSAVLVFLTLVGAFQTQSIKLVWRGTGSDTLSDKPEKNEDKLKKAVEICSRNSRLPKKDRFSGASE